MRSGRQWIFKAAIGSDERGRAPRRKAEEKWLPRPACARRVLCAGTACSRRMLGVELCAATIEIRREEGAR